MQPRRYHHDGREVEAIRFVGNGPEIEVWSGGSVESAGWGLSGTLALKVDDTAAEVEMGDWVVKDGEALVVVPQDLFAHRFREIA